MEATRTKIRRKRQCGGRIVLSLIVLGMMIFSSACMLTLSTPASNLGATQAALDMQATLLAMKAEQDAQGTSAAANATQVAQNVQSTMLAYQGTQLSQQATQQAAQPTSPPPSPQIIINFPTQPPPQPTATPPTSASPTEAIPTPAADIEATIKSAKILLFEDMAGTRQLRYWKEALDLGDYTYTDDGSAQGWFKDHLLSGTDWDLIIAASESRVKIQGEYFIYLNDYIKKGTAVIIEHWDLDDLSQGMVAPILTKCGVALYRDWFCDPPFNPDSLSVWWLQPDHPLLHDPNEGISLRNWTNFWRNDTDKGDLLKLASGGDAVLVGGTVATEKSNHGTLAVCQQGRLIIQTHSSHEYLRDQITLLLENMIYYALRNHFLTMH